MNTTALVRGLAALVVATLMGTLMAFVAVPDAAANHGDVGTDNGTRPGDPCPDGTTLATSTFDFDGSEAVRCIFAPSSRLTTQVQCEAAGGLWRADLAPPTCLGLDVPLSSFGNGVCPPGLATHGASCIVPLRTRHAGNIYKPICIEDSMLQGDAAFADLRINSEIQNDASTAYFIQSGAGCTFDCADGFDANCDGKFGDYCRVEIDRKSVAGAGQCIAEAGPAVQPLPPVLVEVPTTLAHTGAETSVIAFIGLGLTAFGATAMGARRRLG